MAEPWCIPALPAVRGERLSRRDYGAEFRAREERIRGGSSWKLERGQHFEEDDPSLEAFRGGDLATALRLLDEERDALREQIAQDAARDYAFHRVRVVEEPFTTYLRWQLHSLRVQAECGERIRVVPADAVALFERRERLPEVVVLGGTVLYEVRYTERGRPDGAVRYEDPEVVGSWDSFVRRLSESGEDVGDFVRRRAADLPAWRLGADHY